MQKTDFDFEILIHDDASTDNTAAIIREYQNKFPNIIKPIFQNENQYSKGIPIGATFLYPRAKGKFIAECEGDDYWTDPLKLKKQVDILEKNSELMAVVTNSSIVDKQGVVLQERIDRVYPGNIQGCYNLHDYFRSVPRYPTATVMFRNIHQEEILKKISHIQNKYLGDWALWAILHSYGDFYYLDEVTAAYRINPTSLTHTADRVGRAKAHKTICKALSEVLPVEYSSYLKEDGWMCFAVFMAYRKEKKYLHAVAYLFWCMLRYPSYTFCKLRTLVKNNSI